MAGLHPFVSLAVLCGRAAVAGRWQAPHDERPEAVSDSRWECRYVSSLQLACSFSQVCFFPPNLSQSKGRNAERRTPWLVQKTLFYSVSLDYIIGVHGNIGLFNFNCRIGFFFCQLIIGMVNWNNILFSCWNMKRSSDIASLLQKIIKMGDSLLDDCLVTFIERDIFLQLSDGDHPHFHGYWKT